MNSTIARYIEYSRLNPEVTPAEVERVCIEAIRYRFVAVCLNSGYVPLAAKLLAGTGVKVCTVVGFPLGACLTEVKVAEVKAGVDAGANELDMVMNIGYFKSKNYRRVLDEIKAIVAAADKRPVKVIIETALLSDEEKRIATELIMESGASFVKTSTGFGPAGANVRDVKLLSQIAQGRIGVKASGGIRTLKEAWELIEAGATRLGTSAGVDIVKEELKSNKKED